MAAAASAHSGDSPLKRSLGGCYTENSLYSCPFLVHCSNLQLSYHGTALQFFASPALASGVPTSDAFNLSTRLGSLRDDNKRNSLRTLHTVTPSQTNARNQAKKKTVTAIAWNPQFTDLFAVSYGSYEFLRQGAGTLGLTLTAAGSTCSVVFVVLRPSWIV